jgi:tetratricopeptide (TPR) repeat protein
MTETTGQPPVRTVLEQKIRERRQTLEEFVDYVEKFRRDHNEPGTLSLRHLERLIAGHRGDGRPLGPLRPATARLLEHIFGLSVAKLLAPPVPGAERDSVIELRERLSASRQVDPAVIRLLREQLDGLRRLDRQLGAIVAYEEVKTKAKQVAALQSHSLSPGIRTNLATLLAELNALAGWEALDQQAIGRAWDHHERAKLAAHEAGSPALLAHTLAQQAVILIDVGDSNAAVAQLAEARNLARQSAPTLLRSWLAAAHGEGLAAANRPGEALRAFDAAGTMLPGDSVDPELPFLFLGGPHLGRWRGHALARLGSVEAIAVLVTALQWLDPSFTRAQTALHVDLATAFVAVGERDEARRHIAEAAGLANDIGSARHQRRIVGLMSTFE